MMMWCIAPAAPKKRKATKCQRLAIATTVWMEEKVVRTRQACFGGEAEYQVALRSMRRGAAGFVEEEEEMGGVEEYEEYELEDGERRARGWSEEREEEEER